MNKPYKKFHQIDLNRYYVLKVQDELYLGTESIINVQRKPWQLWKPKTMCQGFKLLNVTPTIGMLFDAVNSSQLLKNQEDVCKSDLKYKGFSNSILRTQMEHTFLGVVEAEIKKAEEHFKEAKKEIRNREISDSIVKEQTKILEKRHKELMERLLAFNPFGNIVLTKTDFNKNPEIKGLLNENVEFLCQEKLNHFANRYTLYEYDCYGTLTLHIITETVVKDKRSARYFMTYVLNKEIIEKFINFIKERDM